MKEQKIKKIPIWILFIALSLSSAADIQGDWIAERAQIAPVARPLLGDGVITPAVS
jgi:hypothetical protein